MPEKVAGSMRRPPKKEFYEMTQEVWGGQLAMNVL
jgi:hypothetical protein